MDKNQGSISNDDLFEVNKPNGIKIEFDRSIISKYVNLPDMEHNSNSFLDYDFYDLLENYEYELEHGGPYEPEDAMYQVPSNSTEIIVDEKLIKFAKEIITGEEMKLDEIQLATLIYAILKIRSDFKYYSLYRLPPISPENEKHYSYVRRAREAEEIIEFVDFLLLYLDRPEQNHLFNSFNPNNPDPDKKINKIEISYGLKKNKSKVTMPIKWLNTYLDRVERVFGENGEKNKEKVKKFYLDQKTACEQFLKMYNNGKPHPVITYREYSICLDNLLNHFGITIPNKRHRIIGRIFLKLRIFQDGKLTDDKYSRQSNADRIENYLKAR